MGRIGFGIEKSLRIYAENSLTDFVDVLFGGAAPGGDTGEQDAAPIGSIFLRTNGELYQKIADTDSASDWQLNGASSATIGTWRPETLVAVTGEVQGAGTRDMVANPFSDDDGTTLPIGEFVVGKFVITDAFGTPVLLEITDVTGDDVTFALAENELVSNDTFVVRNYLPDPEGFENTAIVNFNGSIILKIADVDWNFADGIQMASSYASQNGSITSADSVNSAIEKLDGNQQDIQTLTGVAQGETVLGAFTAPVELILGAALTIKSAFQRVGELLQQLRGVQVAGLTTLATVDAVPVASVRACKWFVVVTEDATPANTQGFEVYAINDGSSEADDTVFAKLRAGANFNFSISVDVDAGEMRLRAESSSAGVTVTARRIEVVQSVL